MTAAAVAAYDRLAERLFADELRSAGRVFNIGALVDAPPPHMPAVISGESADRVLTYGELSRRSGRFAGVLAALGVGRGDRVAVSLPQGPECAVVHAAVLKLGALSMPLSRLYGPAALSARFEAASPRAIVCQEHRVDELHELCEEVGSAAALVGVGDAAAGVSLEDLIAGASNATEPVATDRDDPALLLFTSGTSGSPKGVVHAHRVVPGHAAALSLAHNVYPRADGVIWSPADWSWAGGLVNCLFYSWYTGTAICAYPDRRFDVELAVRQLEASRATAVFLPPTAIKRMRAELAGPVRRRTRLTSIQSGSEALDAELCEWCVEFLGVPPNEVYGQTEASAVVGNSCMLLPLRPGSIGRPYPGARVALLDEEGNPVGPGAEGELAVGREADSVFLGYWDDPEETAAKFGGPDSRWLLTGDVGAIDDDGYLWFRSRRDDVIVSAGYRIGPSEIEACLRRHPAVLDAAVVGLPDPDRGSIVAAYLELRPGRVEAAGVDALKAELTRDVSERLAPFQRPRRIEVVDALPRTDTGKVRRTELRAVAVGGGHGG